MTPDRFALPDDGAAAARLCLAQRMPAGDPVQLRAAANRSGAIAAEVRHSADVLLTTAETGLWRGPAHRAFTEQLRAHAPVLTATADRYDDYAAALVGYAGALDEIAPPLGALRRQLQQGSHELASRPDAGGDLNAGLLSLARAFKARYDQWADALDRCIRALFQAGEHDPTRDLHGWQAFSHRVGHVAAAAVGTFERAVLHPSLANISACLGELNAGLSMLGLGLLFIYPPAGAACLAAATVLAVAQLAVDSTRRAHGEQVSNASLGFELAAAIPLGGNALRSLKVADDVVHLVPGGGLAAHEGVKGAHTLAKHVGKSEAFLRNRLATEPRLKAASTFYDRQTAENSIASALRAHQRTVDSWLGGRRYELVLKAQLSTPIGTLLSRASSTAIPARGIKIVLRRNAEMPSGYLIITAMVIE
ncbi:RNase A-like domain-containing protein [Jatrophihabitans sp.]|uniref:RNase A-like domain-containing protein n=1 Tax=Jatrophihabitans sp. TaxID=1932789 RepID=UPI002B590FDA|nr:RNase A-like domain-containing protein [Jatrophihabitans sp.]